MRYPPVPRFRTVVVAAMSAGVVAALVQCSPARPEPPRPEAGTVAPSSSVVAPPSPSPSSSPSPSPSSSPSPPAPPPPGPPQDPPAATVHPVSAAELGPSWRPDCPVPPRQLRRVSLNHIDFQGRPQRGDLVVHQELVPEVIEIFEELHRMRYPIAKMRTLDHYPDASDELSMEDNNTSAFNCRRIPGSGSWSFHAYGRAIDINPVLNPFIDGSGTVEPRNGARFVDRRRVDPGTLHDGGSAVLAFTDRGWRWGGHWRSPLDYQHFERG
ncbi:M15 family metallopeptidase [[Mycobacterium] wendilense]|uniref:M15 family metallopeptidase n=1 Tax=[Mycobacterium] wendilense TaxID=3064284 RepID=A0ABM9MC39_9MYCO|nr:M15 family metallopeptidase [Mycolicibacterium sp. MU0050]CAJ1581602.1 M15 family metallopeptidase [Mycolicibacterium sp. MU0050]